MAYAQFDDFEGTVTITDWTDDDTERASDGNNSVVYTNSYGDPMEFVWLDADQAMALEEAGILELSGPAPDGIFEAVTHEGHTFFLYKAA